MTGSATAVPEAATSSNGGARGYRPELDAVRFLAFLLVFFYHVIPFPAAGEFGWRVSASLIEMCEMGVCLFFTLSAYLITNILLREHEKGAGISVKKFYIRRVLRIWPLYFFGISLGIGIAILLHEAGVVTAFVWCLLFAGNLYCVAFGWFGSPFTLLWSVSIEEQFYLLWPWAMRWFSRRGLMFCAVFLILSANITLFVLGRRHIFTDTAVWTNTLVQFEMFATGILLALAKARMEWRNAGIGLALAAAGLVLLFVACFQFHVNQPVTAPTAMSSMGLMAGYDLIALGCASILQGFCMIGPSRIPRWAAYLGKISYGLYVFHVFVLEFTEACFRRPDGFWRISVVAVVALLLTIAVAILSYEYIESPFLRLKRRFEVVPTRPV